MIKCLLIVVLVWPNLFALISDMENKNEENSLCMPSSNIDNKKKENIKLNKDEKSA